MALLAKLPGLGPRSARRAALALLKRRDQLLIPLTAAMRDAAEQVTTCGVCGRLATRDPCATCADPARDSSMICVVEDDGSLWAMERVGAFHGRYHVLGGLLSALDGVRPEDLRLDRLIAHREARTLAAYRAALAELPDLAAKVERLAALRSAEGYMAAASRDADGGLLLVENHCPICAAATRCQSFCRSEIAVFREALGPGAAVERLDHIVLGARRCAYRITPG